MDHLSVEVEREQELLEWERAEMEMEALRESRLDEERAGVVYPEPDLSEQIASGQLEFGPPLGTEPDDLPF